MAEKKAKKTAEQTAEKMIRKTAERTTSKTAETTKKTVEKTNSTPSTGGEAAPRGDSSDEPVPKKQHTTKSNIEEDLCCMCFGLYPDDVIEQPGKDWVQYVWSLAARRLFRGSPG